MGTLANWARRTPIVALLGAVALLGGSMAIAGATQERAGARSAFLTTLGKPRQLASTVPASGDVNPYGVAVVPATVGALVKGDVLVSNFNDKSNVQGTGTTIMQIAPNGRVRTFADIKAIPAAASCPGGIGLTTALAILPGGWVVVGSLPSGAGGALPTVNPAGCLIVLNSRGAIGAVWSNASIDGPWDLTVAPAPAGADLFVANALSRPKGPNDVPTVGNCTVVRIAVSLGAGRTPHIISTTVIGSKFIWRANKTALIQAPTGVALNDSGTLYVAETLRNRITKIPDAMTRTTPVADGTSTLSSGGALNGPLGLLVAPNGDLVAMNGNDGNAVEINTRGQQVAKVTLIANGAGDLFGAAIEPGSQGLLFVNDGSNAMDVASRR